MPIDEVHKAAILAARTLIEKDPGYTRATARLLLHTIRREILGEEVLQSDMQARYAEYFPQFIKKGVAAELLDEKLLQFDLARLGAALKAERDLQFDYLGLQTLYDRYFLHIDEARIELPQAFFMRVAMGLALNEIDREARAIEFYEVLSSFDFMSSTPTLFNAGTRRSQLSSCYLTTVADDLDGIYEALKENALLSKFAGGLGNDWTNVRALGSHIKGTNGKSQGVVPFLKVVNDTAVAVNQGGKRKGAVCAYLESLAPRHRGVPRAAQEHRRRPPPHARHEHRQLDPRPVHEAGDGRRRLDAVLAQHLPRPARQVRQRLRGAPTPPTRTRPRAARSSCSRRCRRADLWRKMLTMLFETGHPWITFKDACNVRSPQQHVGVVHSSNLCTEITLNTSATEIAVCNLGSVNLAQHIADGKLDQAKLKKTVATAMRMLDNVIDINYYAVKKARDSNLRHRPVGLGIMGFQDALYELEVPYASEEAVEFADRSMEAVCYHAYWASTELAAERGRYSSYRGSLWDRGILPIDSLDLLAEQRGSAEGATAPGRDRPQHDARLGRAARPDRRARHAQLELRRDRADGDDLQHHRRQRLDRAVVRQPVGQVEPVGRVHDRQRVPGARPEEGRPVGRRDGHGPQALRRLAAADRPRARGPEGSSTRPRSRSRRSGWSRPRRGARSGSTRRSRSTSTWPARRARSSTRPTSSPGCAA